LLKDGDPNTLRASFENPIGSEVKYAQAGRFSELSFTARI